MILCERLFWVGLIVTIVPFALTETEKPKKKKDIRDYTDADLERLYDQWEEGDDPLEEDELPEHKRPPQPIDFSQMDPSNPEKLLQMSKKGKTLMVFVTVSGNPSRQQSDDITALWQTSLHNAHMDIQRFMVSDERAIFLFNDGSKAWEAKNFLVDQDRCASVTIEGKDYPGRGAQKTAKPTKDDL